MSEIKFVNILEADDLLKEQVRKWRNKEDVKRFMLTQHDISKEEHSRWLGRLRDENDYKFWVAFSGDVPIGAAYLHDIDYEASDSEWGFYIAEDGYRGKGLSRDILIKLLDEAFGRMNLKTLVTKVISGNERALGIYRKFGFREIGRMPFKDGNEIILLGFTKEDWKRLKEEAGNELRLFKRQRRPGRFEGK